MSTAASRRIIQTTGTLDPSRAPTWLPTRKPAPAQTKVGYQSTWPRPAWTTAPAVAYIASENTDVATAMRTGKPNPATSTGVLMKPPPVPRNVDTKAEQSVESYREPLVEIVLVDPVGRSHVADLPSPADATALRCGPSLHASLRARPPNQHVDRQRHQQRPQDGPELLPARPRRPRTAPPRSRGSPRRRRAGRCDGRRAACGCRRSRRQSCSTPRARGRYPRPRPGRCRRTGAARAP